MNARLQSVTLLVIAALVLLSGVPVSAGDRARQRASDAVRQQRW